MLTLASTQLSLLFDSTSYCFRPFSKEWSMIPPLYKIEIQCIKWRATLSNNHIFQPTVCSEQFSITNITLRWRHNDRDGVWNHQPHDCLLNRLFRRKSKKTSKLRVTGLCAWNSPVTHKGPVTRKMFPFDDVIMACDVCNGDWCKSQKVFFSQSMLWYDSRLFTQLFIQAQMRENIEAPRHWTSCGEFTGDRWIPRTRRP